MAAPAAATAWSLGRWLGGGEAGQIVVVLAATLAGAAVYLAVQTTLGAPEVRLLRTGMTGILRPPARPSRHR